MKRRKQTQRDRDDPDYVPSSQEEGACGSMCSKNDAISISKVIF